MRHPAQRARLRAPRADTRSAPTQSITTSRRRSTPNDDDPGNHGTGTRPLPRRAEGRARRRGAALLRRHVRHLRARQRHRHRPGARGAPRPPPLLPPAERAGDGPHRRRLRQDEEPAADLRLHLQRRARRHQHGDRRRARHRQPPARAAPARRHLRQPRPAPGAPAGRVPDGRRRLRQRRLPPRLEVLRPHRPPGPAARLPARGDARAHRPRRDRRRHPRAARGHPDRGVRLPRGVLRRARLEDPPPGAARGRPARGRASSSPTASTRSSSPAAAPSTRAPATRSTTSPPSSASR